MTWHHRPAERDSAGIGSRDVSDRDAICAITRNRQPTKRDRARFAIGSAARRNDCCFTKDGNVGERAILSVPSRARRKPLWRTPCGNYRDWLLTGEHTSLCQSKGNGSRQDNRATATVSKLTHKSIGFERMMQNQSAAIQKPRQKAHADAGKRGGRKRRKDIRFTGQVAFERHCEAAGEQFSMIARNRHNAAFAGIESDRGEVRRSSALALRLDR